MEWNDKSQKVYPGQHHLLRGYQALLGTLFDQFCHLVKTFGYFLLILVEAFNCVSMFLNLFSLGLQGLLDFINTFNY